METYTEQKARHSKEFGAFEGIFFAFSNEQLAEGMKKIGLAVDDYKSIVSIGAGGYMLKSQVQAYRELCARHNQERKDLKKDEKKLIEALIYELGNHEYGYTGDATDAVESLGYTMETIPQKTLNKAIAKYNEAQLLIA
jgi:hypothetical protein